jgi:DNA-binding NarL/FixJ family response regulator
MELIIAIAEDESNIQSLTNLMKDFSEKIIVLQSNSRIIEYIKSSQPKIILYELTPSNKKQLSFTRNLRGDPETKDMPILALLNEKDSNFFITYKRYGFSGILLKPTTSHKLRARINHIIQETELLATKLKHVHLERSFQNTIFTLNSELTKFVLPELRKILSPQVLKAIYNDRKCIDIRNLPSLLPTELKILNNLLLLLKAKHKTSLVTGKYMGIILENTEFLENYNIFMTMDEFHNYIKIEY